MIWGCCLFFCMTGMALLYLFSGKYQILSLGRSLSVNMFVQSRAMHLALVSCCAESAV